MGTKKNLILNIRMKHWSIHIMMFIFIIQTIDIKAQNYNSILVDNKQRDYILYLPKGLPQNAPLVFAFHGYTGTAYDLMKNFGLNEIADKNEFAVCYPQGLKDEKGNHFWQVGYEFHKNIKVDDVKFICTLSAELQNKYELSNNNTFIIGFSNGGDFCNLLICKTSGIFKAAAPIISCIMKETYDFCKDSKPVPVFMLNGKRDNITFWEGDMKNLQGYGPYLPTKAMLDFRVTQNGCVPSETDTLFSDDLKQDTYVVREKYINEVTGNQVWMYSVINGGHDYPNYINLAQEIWNFFSQYLNK
jgi:polyhydroxybutyrate depolymerase